jgi:alpha-1,2-mannosyltransferase
MMPGGAATMIDAVRHMRWLTKERATAYRLVILIVSACIALGTILTARHGIDRMGKPLGTDFLAFWSASRLALSGQAATAYDLARIYAMEKGSMPVDPGLSSFLYPPPFLLLCLPLGLAPYFLSLAMWIASTGAAYGLVVRRWLGAQPEAARGAAISILAFPAVLSNIGHGQNGFLTAALFGGGLWLLDRQPWIAGALLGALVIKPQMAFAIPVLVLASGRWRVALAGIVAALSFCAASWLLLGPGTWSGFLSGGGTARGILEQGLVEPGKMVSVFAAIQVLRGGIAAGYIVQGLVAIGAATVLAIVSRRGHAQPGGPAALCVATSTLMSPFFLDYDLAALAIPLAWLFGEGLRRGFLPWEKAALVAGYLLPLVARDLALDLGVPIAPLVLIAVFAACARAAGWTGTEAFDRCPVDHGKTAH